MTGRLVQTRDTVQTKTHDRQAGSDQGLSSDQDTRQAGWLKPGTQFRPRHKSGRPAPTGDTVQDPKHGGNKTKTELRPGHNSVRTHPRQDTQH
jgi:hypothetical protein